LLLIGLTEMVGEQKNQFTVDPLSWLSSLAVRIENEEDDHEDFLEHVKLEMFSDQVFCFTPKGDVIQYLEVLRL